MSQIDNKILKLIEESLSEFESSKGSIANRIKKLKRAAELGEYTNTTAWCELQLGNPKYTAVAQEYIDYFIEYSETKDEKHLTKLENTKSKFKRLGFILSEDNANEISQELTMKAHKSFGGLENIEFIEEIYNDLIRKKAGNDGTHYKSNLGKHLAFIKSGAHRKATFIFNQIAFKNVPRTSFDYLKSAVDDRLLDLNPELAEQLMVIFKSVSSNSKEELSQSLTTCRRIIEKFADIVFPPRDELHKGRKVGNTQYMNRLWAFIDLVIESDSNKKLAQSHLEYLGKYLEATHKISNKGVHANLTRIEAIKAVFHLYLIFADLLEHLDIEVKSDGKIDINKATLDELEALGGISRATAKEIVKARINLGALDKDKLLSLKGIGNKTILKLNEHFKILM